MGRRAAVAGGRPVVVSVRLSQSEVRRLDALRAGFSRSTYLRLLLRADHAHKTPEREGV
jgi:hypothetical protein